MLKWEEEKLLARLGIQKADATRKAGLAIGSDATHSERNKLFRREPEQRFERRRRKTYDLE